MRGQILTPADVGWSVGVQERVWEVMGTRNYKIACELLLGAVTSGERRVPHAGNTADTTYRVTANWE